MKQSELLKQFDEQFSHVPGQVLLDLARNESAPSVFRKEAVRILVDKKFPQANHPELYFFVEELKKEKEAHEEVRDIVETAIEASLEDVVVVTDEVATPVATVDVMKAGFTTDSQMQTEVVPENPAPTKKKRAK